VTVEKAGVEVTGLAVYRIVEPLVAYRMLDADRGSLSDILREMFVGATRRIVAGLTLEECLTHRKDRVAEALLREIAPVLSGEGALADATDRGWGVVLDTIEIQDVKVLSQEVFARLQAPYREALALRALAAHEEVLREQARLVAERRREAEAREHAHGLARRALDAELEREAARAEAERARAAIELATKREAGELEAALARLSREAHVDPSEARLTELMLTETLPSVANAFRGSFDRVNVTAGDGQDLFAFLSAGLDQVLSVAQKRGVALPRAGAE
jgi:regulator of protease activity HflC (stomatin/prohibitin superfamily)